MTIHGLLRHVGVDVPDFIVVGDEVIFESEMPTNEMDAEKLLENDSLIDFMNGPYWTVFARLIVFFSLPSVDGIKAKYLHPRELREFWGSLNLDEREYYLNLCKTKQI